MIRLLAKIFIREEKQMVADKRRQAYGMLTGVVGILLNVFLFGIKFFAGAISGSVAITADAFNNLSDAGSSVVTLLGFKLAGTKPDPDHPFGHGRIEYLSGLVVAGLILLMAFELVKDSVTKIIHPVDVDYSTVALLILVISIFVKLYMYFYNMRIGKEIDSAAMRATAMDSISDTVATTVVLVAAIVARYTGWQIDAYCGVLVALFIFYAGITAAKETLDPLLGQPPEPEFVARIEEIVMSYEMVQGIHDMIVHDYGPGRVMVSLHAEVPADEDILDIHDVIDVIEQDLQQQMNCEAVIHMDPIVKDACVMGLRKKVERLLGEIDAQLSMHDFRTVFGKTHTNLLFDVVVPFGYKMRDDELTQAIQKKVFDEIGEEYFIVIKVDKSYVK